MSHAPLRRKAQGPATAQGMRAAPKPVSQLADETVPPIPKFGGSLAGPPAAPPAGGRGGLEPGLRGDMERSFGADFSGVRLHGDAAAARTAGRYSAKAVTVGENVYFGGGRFAPQSGEGRRLIAHELAHVVQQRRGGTTEPRIDGRGGLEHEAGRAADHAVGGGRATVRLGSAIGPAAEPEEDSWFKRAVHKAKDVGSSVKDKATSFVQEVAKDPKVLVDHAEKLQPAVLLAEATQKLADKAEGKPVLGGLTRNVAHIAKAGADLATKPAKAFGEKLVTKDKDGWHLHPLNATRAWQDGVSSGLEGVKHQTFKAINDFEDVAPAKATIDEKAHPTLAALERGNLTVSNATSKYSRQFVGGVAKAAFGMVEGIGKMAVHPFDTVKGLGQLPGPSLVNPLKFIGTFVQLEEDLYDATFPGTEEEARGQAGDQGAGQEPGRQPGKPSHADALRKFGGAMLPDQQRDRRQTVGLAKALGENYIKAWNEKRYGELPGLALVDIGSFFVGGGAAGKGADAASAATKMGEFAKTGEVAGSLAKAEELAGAGGKAADVAKATEAVDLGKGGSVGEATKAAEAHPPAAEMPKPAEPVPEGLKGEPANDVKADPLAQAEPMPEGLKGDAVNDVKADPLAQAEPLPEGLKGDAVNDVKADPLAQAESLPEGLKGDAVNDVKADPLAQTQPLPEGLKGDAANQVRPRKDPKVSSIEEARRKKLEREAAAEAMPLEQKGTGTYGPSDHVGQPAEVPGNALKGERPPEIMAALDRPKSAPLTKPTPVRRGGVSRGTGRSTPTRGGGRPRPKQMPERVTPELPVPSENALAKPRLSRGGGGKAKSGRKPDGPAPLEEPPLREEPPVHEETPFREEPPHDDAPLAGPEENLTKEQLAGKHILEEIAERQRNARAAAKVEANEAARTREAGKSGAGMQANPKHHVFPKEHRKWFKRRGFKDDFDIDNFTVQMEEWAHQAVHAGGDYKFARKYAEARRFEWNNRVMRTLKAAERAKGSRLTMREIFDIVQPLMREYKIPPWFVSYR